MSSANTEENEQASPVARLEQMQDDVLKQLDALNAEILSLLADANQAPAGSGSQQPS